MKTAREWQALFKSNFENVNPSFLIFSKLQIKTLLHLNICHLKIEYIQYLQYIEDNQSLQCFEDDQYIHSIE